MTKSGRTDGRSHIRYEIKEETEKRKEKIGRGERESNDDEVVTAERSIIALKRPTDRAGGREWVTCCC